MAATKEAICIILDVGPSMTQAPAGTETCLETSLDAITMIIQRKVFAESKDEFALVLFGTPETDNPLDDGSSYQNISIIHPLGIPDFDLLETVKKIQPSNMSADFVDALVVGLDHVAKGVVGKRGFAHKRLILFSDLGGEFGDDQVDQICETIKENNTELNIIGPDLDEDDGDGSGDAPSTSAAAQRKEKTRQQRKGEALLKRMLERVEGESYSFSEALPALSYFQARQVRPTPWKCQLEVAESLSIPIAGYIKVKDYKQKQSWKRVYARDPGTGISTSRTVVMNNDEETEVDRVDIVEGHRYGNTIVPMTDDDKENMKYKAEKCFKVLGFTKSENVKRHLYMGDSVLAVVAEKDDQAAAIALSALINALYETNTVAIVRRVYSNATTPRIGVLTPSIKATHECFLYTELPFSEDIREYTFGSLPLTPDVAANKKYTPTDAQLSAMDHLITSMDLTNVQVDGETVEVHKPKMTFNPYFQRLYQCLQQRACNPSEPLPELSPLVAAYLEPAKEVVRKRCEHEEELKGAFKLEVVSTKKEDKTGEETFEQNKDTNEAAVKRPRMDNDLEGGVGELFKAKVTEVGAVTPVDDFRTLVCDASDEVFHTACHQIQGRLKQIVKDSFGSQFFTKAMDCLKALRAECCQPSCDAYFQRNSPHVYNAFVRELKTFLINDGRRNFWEDIVTENQGLLTKLECEGSAVTSEEATLFLSADDANKPPENPDPVQDDDEDDLLADL